MAEHARSPLADRAGDLASVYGGVSVVESIGLAQVDLRLGPADTRRAGFPLPIEPNTVTVEDTTEALWLGPDEWLLVDPSGSAEQLIQRFKGVLDEVHHSLVDVSANRAVLDLAGANRRAVLEAGCGIDLHPRSWSTGQCAQTLLARVPVILQEREGATRVFIRPSFANYLVDWLLDQVVDIS